MSILNKLQRLAKLSLCDWVLLGQLVAFAVLLEVGLRLFSLPSLVQMLLRGAHSRLGVVFPLFQHKVERSQLFESAFLAARIVRGQDSCLLCSLLLFWLLSVRRESAALLIGVRKDTKRLYSHAWIETPSMIKNEVYDHSQVFFPLLRFFNENV